MLFKFQVHIHEIVLISGRLAMAPSGGWWTGLLVAVVVVLSTNVAASAGRFYIYAHFVSHINIS